MALTQGHALRLTPLRSALVTRRSINGCIERGSVESGACSAGVGRADAD